MSEAKKPNHLATKTDCEQLAAYEWDRELDDQTRALWPLGRDSYIVVRTANLSGRLKPAHARKPARLPTAGPDPTSTAAPK